MTTRISKMVLSQMKLIDKSVGVVVVSDSQGLITIDDFDHFNEKSVEILCQVLRSPGGTTGLVSNPRVLVSRMAEANLQGMIYYINIFNSIGRTFTHADIELAKIRGMYHQRDMEESHKDLEGLPIVDSKYWPKTL